MGDFTHQNFMKKAALILVATAAMLVTDLGPTSGWFSCNDVRAESKKHEEKKHEEKKHEEKKHEEKEAKKKPAKEEHAEGESDKPKKKSAKAKKKKKKAEALPAENTLGGEGDANAEFDAELENGQSIDAVLLLDSSGSMARTDPARLRDQAAKMFVRFLAEGDRLAILQFDREVRSVLDFSEIHPDELSGIDKAIDGVTVEGTHTDLELPIEAAYRLLTEKGRTKVTKVVVLLSDGQLDPHPSRGPVQEVAQQLFAVDLPSYKKASLRLYTLAFSPESDREILGKVAREADGLAWYAADPETIHVKFSDLFLALKKPQVLPLDKRGFRIDGSVEDATFYITKKDATKPITILSPKGEELTEKSHGTNVKWYRGEMFEIITVKKPMIGNWYVSGLEDPQGFATLLTGVKLQARWPQNNVPVGSIVKFVARLTQNGKPLSEEESLQSVQYSYKIVSVKDGSIAESGEMKDDGTQGDEKAGDGIFSASLKLEREGDFKAMVAAQAPTFTRTQVLPFSVVPEMLKLQHHAADSFTSSPERFVITVDEKQLEALKNVEVYLAIQKEGEEKPKGIKLKKSADKEEYEYPTSQLPAGKYKVSARLSAKDEAKKTVTGASESIEYTSVKSEHEKVEEPEEAIEFEGETEVEGEHAPSESGSLILGLLGLVGSLGVSGAMAFWVLKKMDLGKGLPSREEAYERPEPLVKSLEALKAKSAERRRKPMPADVQLFALIKEIYQADAAGIDAAAESAPANETSAETPS